MSQIKKNNELNLLTMEFNKIIQFALINYNFAFSLKKQTLNFDEEYFELYNILLVDR